MLLSIDYYPYDVVMKERTFGSKTRYQFDGKEFDEETETEDYGMRTLDEDLGIFLTIDPLTSKYPFYTPYQFAGNKPIVAVDLDGKEEFIYYYEHNEGEPILISKAYNVEWKVDEAHSSANGIAYIPYNKATGKPFRDDEFGKAQYQYFDKEGNRLNLRRDLSGTFVTGDNELMEDWTKNMFGSVYIGSDNPPEINGQPDYRREPQDEADAIGEKHDMDFDKLGLKGLKGTMDDKSTPANKKAINAAENLLTKKTNDKVTGKPVSEATKERANRILKFKMAQVLKNKAPQYPLEK